MTNASLLKSKMILYGDDDIVNCLSNLLEISRQTASSKLYGKSDFSQTQIAIIAEHYDLTDSEIKEIFCGG